MQARYVSNEGCRQGRQAAGRRCKEKLHAKMPEGGIATALEERAARGLSGRSHRLRTLGVRAGVPVSKRCGVERIATLELARSQAGHEPPGALLRGTVGEGVRDNIALTLPLQPVIANSGCGLHRSLHV